ncbi:MAG TPA: GGDEF domain-containing protein [Terriglobia bacterium]|nr:GGDEF domain-containing protein [Terriglobia bacterium]
MANQPGLTEQLGPKARLQAELTKIESQKRDLWVPIIFVGAVLALGAFSLLTPNSFWQHNELVLTIPPQVLFVIMMVVVLVTLYMVRHDAETRRLRLINIQQSLAAQTEQSASMIDSLTNVFSRSFLRDLLEGEIARAERNKRPLGVIMSDLNNFKQVNDRYGHLMGDYVLAQMAGILKSCVRGSDFVVRYGGDEFLVILPETDEPGAQFVKGRINVKVEEWNRNNRIGEVPMGLSLGLHMHISGQSAEQLVAEADARMYAEKLASKNKASVAGGAPSTAL